MRRYLRVEEDLDLDDDQLEAPTADGAFAAKPHEKQEKSGIAIVHRLT
jgi:hypothetical protein